jgi:hypothetical protein
MLAPEDALTISVQNSRPNQVTPGVPSSLQSRKRVAPPSLCPPQM